eukprot:m.166568 g.166568  ORF g.166568 m.166568 type:complete len:254 (+) comp15282_c0_seq8:15-776(+)
MDGPIRKRRKCLNPKYIPCQNKGKEEIANNLTALAPKPAAEEDKTYVCQWKKCGETFTKVQLFAQHVEDHVDNSKVFACEWKGCQLLGKPRRKRSWLHQHVTIHTGYDRMKELVCPIDSCRKQFSSMEALQRHAESHFVKPKPQQSFREEDEVTIQMPLDKNTRSTLAKIITSVEAIGWDMENSCARFPIQILARRKRPDGTLERLCDFGTEEPEWSTYHENEPDPTVCLPWSDLPRSLKRKLLASVSYGKSS